MKKLLDRRGCVVIVMASDLIAPLTKILESASVVGVSFAIRSASAADAYGNEVIQ